MLNHRNDSASSRLMGPDPSFERAFTFLKELGQRRGSQVEQLYAAVASKAGGLAELSELVQHMKVVNAPLTTLIFNAGVGRLDSLLDAKTYLGVVFASRRPKANVFVPLISKAKDFEEASTLIREIEIPPDAGAFASLALKGRNFSEAFSVLARVKATKTMPSADLFRNIISKSVSAKHVAEVFKEMEEFEFRVTSGILESAISVAEDYAEASKVVDAGKDAGIAPDENIIRALAKKVGNLENYLLFRILCTESAQVMDDGIVSGLIASTPSFPTALEIVHELSDEKLGLSHGNLRHLAHKAQSTMDIEVITELAGDDTLSKSSTILNSFLTSAHTFDDALFKVIELSEMGFRPNQSTIGQLTSRATMASHAKMLHSLVSSFDIDLTPEAARQLEELADL